MAADQPVSLRAEVEDGRCRIGVLDRGPGIPPDELETVFRPFYRLEASRSVNTGGSGLGLAIVRQLAMAQGWQVRGCRRVKAAAWRPGWRFRCSRRASGLSVAFP